MKTAIRKGCNRGYLLKRLDQMYLVYDTDRVSVLKLKSCLYSPNFLQLPVSQSVWRSCKGSWGL